jgi:hypothetical protein
MTIYDVITLKRLLMSEISRSIGKAFTQEDVEMFCVPPRVGYEYGIEMRTRITTDNIRARIYLKHSREFRLKKHNLELLKPKIIGIGDETTVFLGSADIRIPNLCYALNFNTNPPAWQWEDGGYLLWENGGMVLME